MRFRWIGAVLLLFGAGVAGPATGAEPFGYTEARARCADRAPERQAFFGELHVHTRHSFDANLWKVRGTPEDAYSFAKGEPLGLAPYTADGKPTRSIRLERPLDFAAVTDHAIFLGPVSLCTTEGSVVYDSPRCRIFRGEIPPPPGSPAMMGPLAGLLAAPPPAPDGTQAGAAASHEGSPGQRVPPGLVLNEAPELCGPGGSDCRRAVESVWRDIKAAAEHHYDRSPACSFTTFHAYEYTATPELSKVHRNVIFRNAQTLALPISAIDEPDSAKLLRRLKDECAAIEGCEVLAIPHNSNLSNGRMFSVAYRDQPLELQRAQAALRAELEPIAEISQIKGDSECKNGMWGVAGAPDELCDYEKIRGEVEDCQEGTGAGALAGQGCQSRLDFVRYALIEGLREAERIGVNPYKLGIVAATDAHDANPGDVNETSYEGWRGASDASPTQRLSSEGRGLLAIRNNPGGLAGVWAEENSRDALFAAMQRRETFGTSGPRMTARFFAGWGLPKDLCGNAGLVKQGYARGVPMGGDLPPQPDDARAPSFVVSALRDPGTAAAPGQKLQRAQIVKGWVGADGLFHQSVVDVAGGDNGASVDPATCHVSGPGYDALCGVWTDPDFDPKRRAVYYSRVVENPSCRWSTLTCNALPAAERPPECASAETPRTVQERLWTSPIWYTPSGV
ncbi:MAG: DUF3604 domain-containing protein [Myxococcales bacterium]|nr:DUF3604 domain-containing protein [Myxococcales bacterium]